METQIDRSWRTLLLFYCSERRYLKNDSDKKETIRYLKSPQELKYEKRFEEGHHQNEE